MISMPSRSTFNHYNLTGHNASKKTTNVSQFFGVEYLNSQLETKDYHATDIKNIVYKDKTNQKRSGYEQVAKAPYNVNGYYEFYDESGNFHQIMHMGTGLYEVTNLEKESHYWETKFNLISNNMANHKSMAFSSKGILYILDGTKYRYLRLNNGSLVLNNVVGSDIVYVPTTSLLNSDGTITAYEDVNLLTMYRKNKLIGVNDANDIQKPILVEVYLVTNGQDLCEVYNPNNFIVSIYTSETIDGTKTVSVSVNPYSSVEHAYTRDTFIWFGIEVDGEIKYSKANCIKQSNMEEKPKQDYWQLDGTLGYNELLDDEFFSNTILNIDGSEYHIASVSGQSDYYFFDSSKIAITTAGRITTATYNGSNYGEDMKAQIHIDLNGDTFLYLYNYSNPTTIEHDISITFFPMDFDNNDVAIDTCTFGIVYNDRLFVSGNPNNKNTDWHTQPITNYGNDETYGDFTYFSDLDYCNYGSDNTSVVGYDIFSDGNLIVFKEPSRFEPTIYRRYKELKVATSYTGEVVENQGTELYEEGYPCFPINTMGGEGGIKNRSITNFLGNTLVLTKSGLKKLYTRQNTYNNERILVDVSSNINLAITKEDLSNAFLFTFKDKLILQIGDITYVAYDSLKEGNEYEWYKLVGIKADIFFEIDNELYFSDIDGNICRFNDGEYVFKDRDRIYTGLGSSLPSGNTITINEAYTTEISDGDKVLMLGHYSNDTKKPLCYMIGNITFENNPDIADYDGYISTLDNKTIIILNNVNESFYDGLGVYLEVDSSSISDKYTLEVADNLFNDKFYIKNSSNNYVDLSSASNVLVYICDTDMSDNKGLKVANYNATTHTFNLVNELDNNVVFYTTGSTGYSCIITHEKNVECYYITKPYDMGSIGYDKTIWQYTIANDTNLESVANIGYIANRKQGISAFAKGSQGLRFQAFVFESVSFLNDGLPHIYTKYRMIPNVNFIKFSFINNESSNMVLSQLSFVYTVSGQVRGSK